MQSRNSKLRHWRAAAELWLWKKGCVVLGPHFPKSRIQGLNHHDWGLRCANYSKTITVKNQECLKQTNDISISESCCRTTLMTGWQQSWQNTNHWTLMSVLKAAVKKGPVKTYPCGTPCVKWIHYAPAHSAKRPWRVQVTGMVRFLLNFLL